MKAFAAALPLAFFLTLVSLSSAQDTPTKLSEGLMHIRTEFDFTVDAPFEQAAPLFGADEERKWSEGWNPQFVYPLPARDQPGMVFKVHHGPYSSTWVNTAFDLANGHIQYTYVLADLMATLIDIHLTRKDSQKTGVNVVYERTALVSEANEHVQHFAKGDEAAAKEWSDAINGYFAKLREQPAPARK